ncbi:hypothetical protein CspHIS471_0604590 [Cutaneotrichosporon sp. HIS471]|nr:hypothetical protein CspHIS471_0604590 [Cutaneotrichosporon sp. HIS471]
MAFSSADLVEGATFPEVMQEGRLAAVFPFVATFPTVKFMLRVRVPNTSDYGSSKLATFYPVIEVLPVRAGLEADDEARSNTDWLLRHAGRSISVQLGGLRVSKVETEGGRLTIHCSAVGPRLVLAGGSQQLLRERSKAATAPRWAFHTPSPAPQLETEARQQIRETSAELSPSKLNPEQAANVPLNEPRPSPAQAQRIPLISHRSRSPRPLSTHAREFKGFKRPPPASQPGKREEKRRRFPSPQASAQAGPSHATVVMNRIAQTRPFPHPTSVRPPPPSSSDLQRGEPVTVHLAGNPTSVPAPRDGPGRQYLPSPSTYFSSRDTIESPFLTQESMNVEDIDLHRTSQPAPTPFQPSHPSSPKAAVAHQEPELPEPLPPRPRVPPQPPVVAPGRRLSVGAAPVPTPEFQRSRSSSSAAADRAARRATILARKAELSAQLRDLEEQDFQERLVAESTVQLPSEVQTHELAAGYSASKPKATLAKTEQEPPKKEKWTYTPLGALVSGTTRHVMGVIQRVDPAKETRGGDWALHMYIRDPTNNEADDTAVTVFRQEAEIQNQPFHIGQAVLFRNLKITPWNNRPKGHAYRTPASEWCILLGGKKTVQGGQPQPHPVCQDEITRLKALAKWYREAGGTAPGPQNTTDTSTSRLSSKRRALGEVTPGDFFDATVKIMHVHTRDTYATTHARPKYELYITDGTVNPQPTHNFHNVDIGTPPGALMCLTVFSNVDEASERLFKYGAILHFKNMNANRYRGQGDLELKWSDKVTGEQLDKGWKNKRCYPVEADKPEAIEIEERIKALKAAHSRGETVAPLSHQHQYAQTNAVQTLPSAPRPVRTISTALMTKFTDEASHPRSTVAQILANTTAPNRFRTLARVKTIHSRDAKGSAKGDLAVLWCKRCNNTFAKDHCQTCNDRSMKNAEVRWQLLLVLEPERANGEETPPDCAAVVVLDGDDAAAILPALPPLAPGPNEVARLRKRISGYEKFKKPVEDLLLGPDVNGERTPPLIDWTVESYASGPNGQLDHLCFRVFGMRSGS